VASFGSFRAPTTEDVAAGLKKSLDVHWLRDNSQLMRLHGEDGIRGWGNP
jgi:hypothetical protein